MPTRDQVRTQGLSNPPHENPTGTQPVRDWMAARAAADRQMQAASARRTAEPAEPGSEEASTDVVQVLTRQHNQVQALQERLGALPGHMKGGSSEDMAARKSIVDLIAVHLARHEMAEEEHLWPTVRAVLPDGDELAAGAVEQEQEGRDTLTRLGRLGPDTDEFDQLVERLVRQLRKHVAYEERVFLRLREAMPQGDREALGEKVLRASKHGPARPGESPPGSVRDASGDQRHDEDREG